MVFIDDGLPCVAVGFPFLVAGTDEGLDEFEVVGGEACVGVADGLRQDSFVGGDAEDGFFAAESLEELGGHHTVRLAGSENEHNG